MLLLYFLFIEHTYVVYVTLFMVTIYFYNIHTYVCVWKANANNKFILWPMFVIEDLLKKKTHTLTYIYWNEQQTRNKSQVGLIYTCGIFRANKRRMDY